ncbi:MAG: adenosine deaminase [Lachnospiraceae bacterium]|uniref:adenosine deaminase n=1 Tax=Candidatus Weimeria bifida TaxID=2599074 RepID=A0A6N7J0J4_9FIRM|nr:adenosine deaminase [Candidatus Weimeria bifida]RRF96781.1 MAG: adenosine deaminase [Lachnospiraceae bacterium]
MDREQIKALPKVELHCHLDGSLSPEFISSHLGRSLDFKDLSVSIECASLNEYLEKFDAEIKALSTPDAVRDGVMDVLAQADAENVRYMEIRFDPFCLAEAGNAMTPDDAVAASIEGLRAGTLKYGVKGNIILCAMRHFDLEKNLGTLSLVEKYLGKGVCCMDLAGAEAVYPTSGFKELFKAARTRNVPYIIHAGEADGESSIRAALSFGAKRIGHGVRMQGIRELENEFVEKGIPIEMCPTSNFQTKAVTGIYPLREFIDAGIMATINTDNRTVSNTTLTDELESAKGVANLTDAELVSLEKNAVNASFADEATKNDILKELEAFL